LPVKKVKEVAEVAVFVPLRRLFYYSFKPEEKKKLKRGVRVVVPFRSRNLVGVFLKFEKTDIETKVIHSTLDDEPLFNAELMELVLWVSKYYLCGAGELFKMISPREELKNRVRYFRGSEPAGRLKELNRKIYDLLEKELSDKVLASKVGITARELDKRTKRLIKKGLLGKEEEFYFSKPRGVGQEDNSQENGNKFALPTLTKAQQKVISDVSSELKKKSGKTTLLFGVTGSGKTEVYLNLCAMALNEGGRALILVPEIALTFQLLKRFRERFGDKIAILHSALSGAERRHQWRRVKNGDADIVIGARSAVFAPIENLRFIAVDEEHDSSYKQHDYPYYNGRDVAVMRGKLTGAAVLLGSATPMLETFYNAKNGKYLFASLPERIDSLPLPPVSVIPRDISIEAGGLAITSAIVEKIIDRLSRNEQSMIFINRRGSSQYLRCRACNELLVCPNCSISLTHHTFGAKRLECHYCGYVEAGLKSCKACGATGELFEYAGAGTQKVEALIKKIFPKAKVARLDHDTAPTREKMFAILENYEKGKTDILIGTQMTAKGHDFKNLTFSLILGSDDYLAFPDFRSAERTFSLITQAAGRTGRGEKGGEVIIEGNGDNYAVKNAKSHDYESFYKEEITKREAQKYPPFFRLIGLYFSSNSQELIDSEMQRLSGKMPTPSDDTIVLGPVPALIFKVRNRYRWKLLLKGKNSLYLHNIAVDIANMVDPRIAVSIDVDPIGFY